MQHSDNHNESNNKKKCNCGAWLWPFILVLAGAIILSLILRACNLKAGDGMLALTAQNHHSDAHGETHDAHAKHANSHEEKTVAGNIDADGNFQYDLGAMTELKLQDGSILKVGENSTEAKLFHFLSDSNAHIDANGNWFDFTNVNFKTSGDAITETSMDQLKNLSKIINNFPNVKFKVGGYTDNTGDTSKNKILSQKRAENVAKTLVDLGINKNTITSAEGYGQEHPVASNETPEGRAQNRRVSVNIKAK